ncbi:hypothetical protein AK830_g9330 [Neonectria ditissima]|uniref:BZIP domain-containing protein n=1 Tax=Neonectria ditissima TaxID=78410 RepID=A0A0P7B5X1_9HYPO|nr:hypothetical protein AK830_g9330 [Neonectria ditissima]
MAASCSAASACVFVAMAFFQPQQLGDAVKSACLLPSQNDNNTDIDTFDPHASDFDLVDFNAASFDLCANPDLLLAGNGHDDAWLAQGCLLDPSLDLDLAAGGVLIPDMGTQNTPPLGVSPLLQDANFMPPTSVTHLFSAPTTTASASPATVSNNPPSYAAGLSTFSLDNSPASSSGASSSKRKADSSPEDEAAAANVKRQRNTMAARKYRQKRLDRIAELEQALANMTGDRDDLRLKLVRREAEVDALREMLGSKK